MSELALLLVGLVLCFAGARSLRLTVLVAGFGLCWLLADAFGANVATTFVVAAVGALAGLVLSVVMSRFVIFLVGAAVGAVIGARLFALLGGDDPSWVLAVLFVPTFGFVAGFLAQRMGRRSLRSAPPSPALPSSCRPSARCSATISDSCRRPTAPRSRPCTPSCGSRSGSSATKSSAPRCVKRTPRRPLPRQTHAAREALVGSSCARRVSWPGTHRADRLRGSRPCWPPAADQPQDSLGSRRSDLLLGTGRPLSGHRLGARVFSQALPPRVQSGGAFDLG